MLSPDSHARGSPGREISAKRASSPYRPFSISKKVQYPVSEVYRVLGVHIITGHHRQAQPSPCRNCQARSTLSAPVIQEIFFVFPVFLQQT